MELRSGSTRVDKCPRPLSDPGGDDAMIKGDDALTWALPDSCGVPTRLGVVGLGLHGANCDLGEY